MSKAAVQPLVDPFASQGTITLEYYDGSTDFSESEDEELESPNNEVEQSESPPLEESRSSSANSSTENVAIRNSVEFKTYDFKHPDTEREFSDPETTDWMDNGNHQIVSTRARLAMRSHYRITHKQHMNDLTHPKASFYKCPKGGARVRESGGKRGYSGAGPFLTCPFSHQCGDEFIKIPIFSKPCPPEINASSRPCHLKERKARFFKQCKYCDTLAFTHHRNPAQHYEEYLNHVTYKQHNTHAKIWPQHLADLKHVLEGSEDRFDDKTAAKCKDYTPSEIVVHSGRYIRQRKKKAVAVITRRRSVLPPRLPRRYSAPKMAIPKTPISEKSGSMQSPLRPDMIGVDQPTTEFIISAGPYRGDAGGLRPGTKADSRNVIPTGENATNQSRTSVESSDSSEVNHTSSNKRPITLLSRRLRTPMTRLIKSRQASSKISKRFVKKPEPPKEAKYIQKLKPNISAKFLRTRSKNRASRATTGSISTNVKRGKDSTKKFFKTIRTVRVPTAIQRKMAKILPNDETSEDGDESYANYRDQNGEFDPEKYRQSILKMLIPSGMETGRGRKKKQKSFRKYQSTTLPKVKNLYSNVKSKVVSNVPQKRKKHRKSKAELTIDLSTLMLKSKFSSDSVVEAKDSYFSIPGLDN